MRRGLNKRPFTRHIFLLCTMVTYGLCAARASAQNFLHKLDLPGPVHSAGLDRPGDLYVVIQGGEIQKVSKDGQLLGKRQYTATPTLFDPRDGVRSFAYFRNSNTFEFLSADLTDADSHRVLPEFAISPWLVCPTKNEVWIFDAADYSMKKTGASFGLIEREFALKGISPADSLNFSYLREYQNFLFLLSPQRGILAINSLGTVTRTLGKPGLRAFHFLGEEVYYHEGNQLHLTDLYTSETRTITLPYACDEALLSDERLFLIRGNRLEIFSYQP
ncbi:MAG: hypothetical protein ACOYXA_10070 [Bacteroidota bacterium]